VFWESLFGGQHHGNTNEEEGGGEKSTRRSTNHHLVHVEKAPRGNPEPSKMGGGTKQGGGERP